MQNIEHTTLESVLLLGSKQAVEEMTFVTIRCDILF
jgi:hypothetical protein